MGDSRVDCATIAGRPGPLVFNLNGLVFSVGHGVALAAMPKKDFEPSVCPIPHFLLLFFNNYSKLEMFGPNETVLEVLSFLPFLNLIKILIEPQDLTPFARSVGLQLNFY